ncbi:hypothetical protein THAOC_02302 [Thalassiosira oceanica]|uniref:Uncharacterized protein n=1 Tax=Thalassiosira oceanica TaxID=159749 RepID=K0TB09_THAOC|nr:hypothetical protein THAOC_02302 [Thalassiosira oceanica]|eukprot:EJK75958.1 hypothetical protein THAOC_02302 [Thalassiosira oceanica]
MEILTSTTAGRAERVMLMLQENAMSSSDAPTIANFLASDPPLRLLSLAGNLFDGNDATVLANSLSSNTNLRLLDIGRNNTKDEGRLAFLRAIFDVSSLASCAASNHTCQIRGVFIWELNCDGDVPWNNKWEKIFAMLALSSEDLFINTALLRGVPASLIPVILYRASYQFEENNSKITDLYLELTDTNRCKQHDVWDNLGCTRPLNCMYELIRSWVVPFTYV